MKNKGFFISIGILFSFFGCSQNVKETYKIQPTMNIIQNPHINASNIVEELTKEVKHYPKEPVYLISFGRNFCFVEILVNDIPVYKAFNSPNSATATEVNQAIIKNGIQKVIYKLYPVGEFKDEDRIYNYKTFDITTFFETKVKFYDKNNHEDTYGTIIKEYKTSTIPNPKKGEYPDSIFIATGKDYYEGSFTFEAHVPYTLQNFDKAKDLRKMDTKVLESKLLKKYQDIWIIYQNKEYDNIARIMYDRMRNDIKSYYLEVKDGKESWEDYMRAFSNPTFKMQPIENYEMKFFADGKLVVLMSKSQEYWLRGNTALWGKYEEGGDDHAFTSNAYFYILEGENDFRVY